MRKMFAMELSGVEIGQVIQATWTGPRGGKQQLRKILVRDIVHRSKEVTVQGWRSAGRGWSKYVSIDYMPPYASVTVTERGSK